MAWNYLSLRQVLTIPYVVLMLAVVAIVGGFSYVAGSQAVSTMSGELLRDMAARISQAVDRHLVGSRVALDAAFPDGAAPPALGSADPKNLRRQLWVAASLNPDPNNYVYYGNRDGLFAGVVRHADGSGEWRVREADGVPRRMSRFAGLEAPLEKAVVEPRMYDPRERPWYRRALEVGYAAWSPIYVDTRTGELVATRVKPLRDRAGAIEGVAATDVSLKKLNDFVRALSVSKNGVAFVAERDGMLIASSSDDSTRLADGKAGRVNASQSGNALVRAAYAELSPVFASGTLRDEPLSRLFDGPDGKAYASVSMIRDPAGLEWITVVAVPRADFMGGVVKNVTRTATIALGAALIAILLGMWVLNWVSHDLKLLSTAARRLGEGHLYTPVGIARRDELGELARNFEAMHISLQTDKLTNVFNRDTFEKQLVRRIEEHRVHLHPARFAVLFVDLDHFKKVNDELGHQIGDTVLVEVANRLKHSLRSGDMVGRYGGDEFVVLLHEVEHREAAERVRQKIEQRMTEPLVSMGSREGARQVTASVGLAFYPDDGADAESLLYAADQEMYARKFALRAPG